MKTTSDLSGNSEKSNGEAGRLFKSNVYESLLTNLNVEVLSNQVLMANKYQCFRLSLTYPCYHPDFVNVAIPIETHELKFTQIQNIFHDINNSKTNVRKKTQVNSQTKKDAKRSFEDITLINGNKYSLTEQNNYMNVRSRKKEFNLRINKPQEVNNLIWLILKKRERFIVQIFEKNGKIFF